MRLIPLTISSSRLFTLRTLLAEGVGWICSRMDPGFMGTLALFHIEIGKCVLPETKDWGRRLDIVRAVSCPGKIKIYPWFRSNSCMMLIKFWQFDHLFEKICFLYAIFQISGAGAHICNESQCKLFPDQIKCCIMLKLLNKNQTGHLKLMNKWAFVIIQWWVS